MYPHLPHPHVPHHVHHPHVPHPDLREFGRDALIAAEVTVAALVLAAAVDGRAVHRPTDGAGSEATATSSIGTGVVTPVAVVPTIDVRTSAAPGVEVHVVVPTGAAARVTLVDAAGRTVAEVALTDTAAALTPPEAGTYALVLHTEGPVEMVGEVGISSATAVRSAPFAAQAGEPVTVTVDR